MLHKLIPYFIFFVFSGVEQLAARQSHKLKAAGSSSVPATSFACSHDALLRSPLVFHAGMQTLQRELRFVRLSSSTWPHIHCAAFFLSLVYRRGKNLGMGCFAYF